MAVCHAVRADRDIVLLDEQVLAHAFDDSGIDSGVRGGEGSVVRAARTCSATRAASLAWARPIRVMISRLSSAPVSCRARSSMSRR